MACMTRWSRPADGSRFARANLNMSFRVERSAPAPANVGMSQFGTDVTRRIVALREVLLHPRRQRDAGVIHPERLQHAFDQQRLLYVMPARRASATPSSPTPRFEYSYCDPMSRVSV